jgi:hypothetical protein
MAAQSAVLRTVRSILNVEHAENSSKKPATHNLLASRKQ